MASIGSSLAAFLAGYQPKNMPVKVHTAKLMMMLHGSICVAMWKKELRLTDSPTPSSTPMMPPVTESNIASIRNWFRMSMPLAPTLILKPISRVRSVTDTYIMFMMPIPPTKSEMPATEPSRMVMVDMVLFIMLDISSCERMVKSSSSASVVSVASFNLWVRRKIEREFNKQVQNYEMFL